MLTNRDFNFKKRSFVIKEDFLKLNEEERYNLGSRLDNDGINYLALGFLIYENEKYYFDFELLKYFNNIISLRTYYENTYNEIKTKIFIKNFEYLIRFKETLEEIGFATSLPFKEIELLINFPKLISAYFNNINAGIIYSLHNLKQVSLAYVDFNNNIFNNKNNLEYVFLEFCKNLNNLNLCKLNSLKGFFAMLCKDISDLTFLSFNSNLEAIQLEYVPKIIKLPDFSKCTKLKYLKIEQATNLVDISSISTAPNIEIVFINNCKYITYEKIIFLSLIPTLKYIYIRGNTLKEVKRIKELFGEKYNTNEICKTFILSA